MTPQAVLLTTESCREQKHRTVTESSGFRGALGGDQHKLCFLRTGIPPHASDYRNLRERQCQACTSTASPYWNICQHTLACAHTWLNHIPTTKKLNHRRDISRGKRLLLLHHGKRKAANCLWCHEMCFPTTHTGWEFNFSFKVSGSKL